jgi:hypothetical protein
VRARLPLLLSLPAAVLLAWAGVLKVIDPQALFDAVRTYRLLPDAGALGVAFVLPWLEVCAAGALLVPAWWRAGAWLALALFTGFIAGVSQAWIRGLELTCGCFGGAGPLEGTGDFAGVLLRNTAVALALVAALVLEARARRASAHNVSP